MQIKRSYSRQGSLITIMLMALTASVKGQVLEGFRHYLFLSDQRIVTVELINPQKAILNYINIGDTYEFFEAPNLLVLDSTGDFYHGHAVEVENFTDPNKRFKVSELIEPNTYRGYTILGKYDLKGPVEKVYLKVGSVILELAAVFETEFNLIAVRIGKLDLTIGDGKQMVTEAGFQNGHGTIYRSGAQELKAIDSKFLDVELVPPIVLVKAQPSLPAHWAHLSDPVVVQLEGIIRRSGGLSGLQVSQGINPELNQRALDTVVNSWSFLPAISKGEIVDTELIFNVVFKRVGE